MASGTDRGVTRLITVVKRCPVVVHESMVA